MKVLVFGLDSKIPFKAMGVECGVASRGRRKARRMRWGGRALWDVWFSEVSSD